MSALGHTGTGLRRHPGEKSQRRLQTIGCGNRVKSLRSNPLEGLSIEVRSETAALRAEVKGPRLGRTSMLVDPWRLGHVPLNGLLRHHPVDVVYAAVDCGSIAGGDASTENDRLGGQPPSRFSHVAAARVRSSIHLRRRTLGLTDFENCRCRSAASCGPVRQTRRSPEPSAASVAQCGLVASLRCSR